MPEYDDAGERAKYRKAQRDEKSKRTLRELAIKGLLADQAGRELLWHLLELAGGTTRSPFNPDPYVSAFQCGEHNVGLKILAMLVEVDPTGFITLQKEHELVADSPEPDAESDTDSGPEPATPAQPPAG